MKKKINQINCICDKILRVNFPSSMLALIHLLSY